MSSVTHAPINRAFMPNPERPQKLEEIIRKVQTLRNLTKSTGFFTTRSIGALLATLTTDELLTVAEALDLSPRELSRSGR